MVIRELRKRAADILSASGNGDFEARMLMGHFLGLSDIDFIVRANDEVSEYETVLDAARKCADGEPIQYIIGTQEFMSLEFDVNPSVLIPRADTEVLVEHIIEKCGAYPNGVRILDIGTGSGCISVSTAYYAKNAHVTAADISQGALDTARKNAVKNGVSERVEFVLADIMSQIPFTDDKGGKFDIIVSNPPYIRTTVIDTLDKNVREFEPHTALDGGADGLVFYRRIVDIAPLILKKGGTLAFEIGFDQGADVSGLMSEKFEDVKVIKDLCKNDRIVSGILK